MIDKAGVLFPALARKKTGQTILNPGRNSIFIEVDLAIPNEASPKQYLFNHMLSGTTGYAAYLDTSLSSEPEVPLVFCIISGSSAISTTYKLPKKSGGSRTISAPDQAA
ncbi:MAG TPA: hypothetical protein EYQ00_07420 [Dehalococcoidia bacterium]|nr:hypothetical protein [Dehalococcoidia bacterium]